jgi:hypothetical protein
VFQRNVWTLDKSLMSRGRLFVIKVAVAGSVVQVDGRSASTRAEGRQLHHQFLCLVQCFAPIHCVMVGYLDRNLLSIVAEEVDSPCIAFMGYSGFQQMHLSLPSCL